MCKLSSWLVWKIAINTSGPGTVGEALSGSKPWRCSRKLQLSGELAIQVRKWPGSCLWIFRGLSFYSPGKSTSFSRHVETIFRRGLCRHSRPVPCLRLSSPRELCFHRHTDLIKETLLPYIPASQWYSGTGLFCCCLYFFCLKLRNSWLTAPH